MKSQSAINQHDHLDINSERRKNTKRDMEGVGRWALSIPHEHYPSLVWPMCKCEKCLYQQFPELASQDRETQNRAWLKFMKSSDSIPYRVGNKL